VEDLWRRVLAGESGIHTIRLFDTSEFKVKFGGDVYDWDPSHRISAKDVKRLDRFTQFAIVAGMDAVADAGLQLADVPPFRVGVIIGSGIGGLQEIETQVGRLITKGPDRVSALTIPKLMLNAAGGTLGIHFAARGPNYSVATACASATNALGNALKTIQDDEADIVISGGTEAALTPMGLAAFQNMKALSMHNEHPAGASRPFDAMRDGFVLSEGAGIVILEELDHARARGARIYAEMLGFGATCDAGHITQPDEMGTGAAQAMRLALKNAQVDPSAVDYINAHGTSTPLGDVAETRAIRSVFQSHATNLSISSTKSQLGHSLGASGGIELVLTVLAIAHRVVPPTSNLNQPDPECDLDYTPNHPRERQINVAISNSFGFGGHNASIVAGRLR
jgi:3-oxoacyl-[acyl-carrier-protein] synthase II